jgi:hypothetical protein
MEFLRSSLAEINPVSDVQIATLELRLAKGPALDDGEKHLLAHAITRQDFYLLCGPDKAMIRAANVLTIMEKVVSLSELATEAHVAARQLQRLGPNFKKPWLEEERAKVRLGYI